MSVLITVIIVDTSLVKISNYIGGGWFLSSNIMVIVFIGMSTTYVIGQHLIFRLVKQRSKEINTSGKASTMINNLFGICQHALSLFLLYVILQIFFESYYSSIMLTTVVSISYVAAVIMLAVLARQFFGWLKVNKTSVVLVYGLSTALLASNAGITLVFVDYITLNMPTTIGPHTQGVYYFYIPGSMTSFLKASYIISSFISFVSTWGATALLLHHYSQRIGRIKYWITVSLPLVYFVSQFISLFLNLFESILRSNPIFYGILLSIIFTVSTPAGGILFGIAFWTMSRTFPKSSIIRDYVLVAAVGFVLLFVSNQAIVLLVAPYPPFGLASSAFVGLSSYLILIGLYYSAITFSKDAELRKTIRESTVKELRLLGSIGSAQMEEEIKKMVMKIVKEQKEKIDEAERFIPSSLDEDDLSTYMEQVLNETKIQKKDDL